MIKKLRDRDMGVSEAEFSKPRSCGRQVVWRLRGQEFERLGFMVIKKLRDGMWVLVKLKVYESKKLGAI